MEIEIVGSENEKLKKHLRIMKETINEQNSQENYLKKLSQ